MSRKIRLTPYDEEFERSFDEQEFDENAGNDDPGDYGYPPSMTIGHYAPVDNRMPIFLAGEDEAPMQRGFGGGGEIQHVRSIWPRILRAGSFTAAAAGIALAIASMDNPLSLFSNAKASLPGTSVDQSSAAEAAPAPAPKVQSAARVQVSTQAPSSRLTREDIAAALRGARQQAGAQQVQPEIPQPKVAAIQQPPPAIVPRSQTAVVPQPRVATPPAVRLEADELANLMKRAKALIAVGDISPARLLLERAAEAQEVSAALLLAQTYDPAVLGTQDLRSITADPAMARTWYQKAAQLGSPEALGRLAQLQN